MTNSCHHPVLNPHGTYKTSDNKFWYETSTVSLNSTADCFIPANIGTVNGRPDSKSDKYIYPDQFIDCREFAKLSTKADEELLRQDKVEWAVDNLFETVISSKELLDVELLGDSLYYPQTLLDRISSSVTTHVTLNLVDDNGVSNVPDGVKTAFKMSQKMTVNHQVLKSTDSGGTWTVESPTVDYVTNTITFGVAPLATDIILVSSTAANKPYHQTDPKPVLEVEPKVTASNDNSIYKGAMITAQVSGKISVGNSANGLESVVLENAVVGVVDFKYTPKNGVALPTIYTGERVYISGQFTSAVSGNGVYEALIDVIGWIPNTSINTLPVSDWKFVGYNYTTTPQHPTITLNADTTSASKYFKVTEEEDGNLYAGIYGEEITYDGISEWGDTDFSQLTNGTLPDVNGGADIKTFHGSISLNIKRR